MVAIDAPGASEKPAPILAGPWVSYALAALAVGAGGIGLALGLVPSPEDVLVAQNVPGTLTTFGLMLVSTIPGLILRRNRPEHPVAWILLLFGVTVGLSSVVWGVTYVAGLPGGDQELGRMVAWTGSALTAPAWNFLALSLIVRFPSGRPESPADARLLRVGAIACIAAAVLAGLRPGPFLVYPAFSNPLTFPPVVADALAIAGALGLVVAFAPVALAGAGMVGRYRRAALEERLQLRWFAYGLSLALGGALVYLTVGVLVAPGQPVIRDTTYVVMIVGVGALPVSILQSIMRHRLYDIDTIIGRTFAYGALTAILAGLYAAAMRGFNALFVAFTGQESEAALVLTTLVLATTFTPVKTRLEKVAEKRFMGQKPGGTDPADPTPRPSRDPSDDPGLEALVRRMVDEALRAREPRNRRR